MMIKKVFEKAKEENRTVFMPYFPAGYPTLAKSKKALLKIAESKADLIEVGIPFSDPIADGPVIQQASTTSLNNGLKVSQVFDLIKEIKSKLPPVLIMTYYNILYSQGLETFAKKAARAGIKGVLIPDLALEEADEWLSASKPYLETGFFVAPTSSNKRIKKISKKTSAFIYAVSITGVTGARDTLQKDTVSFLKRIKAHTDKPVAVGFGISNAQQVKQLKEISDGIIVGSGLIEAYTKGKSEKEALLNLEKFIKNLKI